MHLGGEKLDWQTGMNRAMGYIEEHLADDIDLAVAAQHTGCSVWEFQRVFSFITHVPVGEYIRRRRMTLAADDLANGSERIIDIALKYSYDSPAAFTRAFSQWHGITPSQARGKGAAPKAYPKITFETGSIGRSNKMNQRNGLQQYADRGYYVRENAPVYFTNDMDGTCKWFREVLGWYGDIVARDDAGKGMYGCVFDYPGELIAAGLTPFRGIHLFAGEPSTGVAGFILVQGLDQLHQFIKANGWEQVTDIEVQPWGARECQVTTPDGCILRFFETNK